MTIDFKKLSKKKRLQKRLDLYTTALVDYQSGQLLNGFFCLYFRYEHELPIYNKLSFERLLPELYQTKPYIMYIDSDVSYPWFINEDFISRIKCLKKAIEITEQKIKELCK